MVYDHERQQYTEILSLPGKQKSSSFHYALLKLYVDLVSSVCTQRVLGIHASELDPKVQ